MTSFQGAQFPASQRNQAQAEIIPQASCNVHACPLPLGNTSPIEDDITHATDGNTVSEPETKVGESYKKKGKLGGLGNLSLRSKRGEAYRVVKSPKEDETNIDNLHKNVNVIKTVTLKLTKDIEGESLKDPDVFVLSGKSHSLFKDIPPGERKGFLFAKTPWSWRGAVGICTYRVGKTDDRVAIYYSNPFIGHNSFGIRWVTASHVTDANTYYTLFSGDNKQYVRDTMKEKKVLSLSGLYVAKGFMTQGEHVEMDVNVSDYSDD